MYYIVTGISTTRQDYNKEIVKTFLLEKEEEVLEKVKYLKNPIIEKVIETKEIKIKTRPRIVLKEFTDYYLE